MDYNQRIDDLLPMVNSCPVHTRRDLNKMVGSCRALADLLSQAEVDCRRLHTTTAIYSSLSDKFNEQITELEHWITLAQLS